MIYNKTHFLNDGRLRNGRIIFYKSYNIYSHFLVAFMCINIVCALSAYNIMINISCSKSNVACDV
jgi:hypothetical protein